jgi:hypothetical protein
MPTYSIFGGSLCSDVTLPELRRTRATAVRWTLRIAPTGAAINNAHLLGLDEVMPGVDVRLYKTPGGYRLAYDDTGNFDISRDGRDIVWSKGPYPSVEAAQLDIINRVLPLALHASGTFCLHGSAVSLNTAGIAFVAPRGYGKSTLALAMMQFGARILTDDTLAVRPRAPVLAWPGVHSVRLMDDAASALVGDANGLKGVAAYPMPRRDRYKLPPDQPLVTKQILRGLPERKLMLEPTPLAAIYVLVPSRPDGADAARRRPLSGVHAAVALVQHAKCGVLLGKSEAPVLFERAATVARETPVFWLSVVRDLGRIAEVAQQVARWHPSSNGHHAIA